MATNWTEVTPEYKPRAEHRLTIGPCYVSVSDAQHKESGETWQYLSISLGEHSAASIHGCLKTWPRRALELARAALDNFETNLNQQEQVNNETAIH